MGVRSKGGGKNEKWAGTSNESELGDYAWYDKNSGSKTHPVGQKKPNGLGLYDMSGNVWEWVNDWYGDKYYGESPKNNPKGPNSRSNRVLRGGNWSGDARYVRASLRNFNTPVIRRGILGFRVAKKLLAEQVAETKVTPKPEPETKSTSAVLANPGLLGATQSQKPSTTTEPEPVAPKPTAAKSNAKA